MSIEHKYISQPPSNPEEVDIRIKAFIEEWNKKPYKQTYSDMFIDDLVKKYITTEKIWNNSYDHILLLLLGEITRLENMIMSPTINWGKNDLDGCIRSMHEYRKLLSIL